MTDLEIRRIPFRFDETVQFQWHPTNPEFGVTMNAVGIIAIVFEKYVVAATRQASPSSTSLLCPPPARANECNPLRSHAPASTELSRELRRTTASRRSPPSSAGRSEGRLERDDGSSGCGMDVAWTISEGT